jgi:hypothetical protein
MAISLLRKVIRGYDYVARIKVIGEGIKFSNNPTA